MKKSLLRLIIVLGCMLMMTASVFADNPNTDDDAGDIDGEHLFTTEGEKYGYRSYLNCDENAEPVFVGGRFYDVTIPDEGTLTAEINSDDITHMTIEIWSYAEKKHICRWDLVSDSGVKGKRETMALPKGKYKVQFFATYRPSSSWRYDHNKGIMYFYHYISWKKASYTRASSVTVTPSAKMVKKGEYVQLEAAVSPSNAYYQELTWTSSNSGIVSVDSTGYARGEAPGTAVIKATNKEGLSASCTVTVSSDNESAQPGSTTVKSKNTLTVKGKTASVRYSKLKKKTQKIAVTKVIRVSKAKGTVTYTKKSGSKKITINRKTGKVTVKKGLKKGTYKVKIKVRAAGTSKYKSLTKTVTFRIKVK